MNSRGFADPDCNSYTSSTSVEFWHNADSASVQILPLGQLTW